MFSKFKTYILILLFGLAFFAPLASDAIGINTDNSINEDENIASIPPIDEENLTPNAPMTYTLANATWFSPGTISAGQDIYFVLEDVPFNSGKYRFGGWEWSPATINIDVYMKFEAHPTTSDYDYRAQSSDQYEYTEVPVPNDDEYGDMYILIHCVSGSGTVSAIAWYVDDYNGCWRSADSRSSTQTYTTTLSGTDTYDFYRVYLYSGDILTIDADVLVGSGVGLYLYSPDRVLLDSDLTGLWMDITYEVTAFETGYYYLEFKCLSDAYNNYHVVLTQDKTDVDNRYTGAFLLNPETSYLGAMAPSDVNDYYYFYADSGDHLQITVTINDPVSSPYFDMYIYASPSAINDNYLVYDASGTTLTADFYSSEFYTQEVSPYTSQNKIYIRLWNAAYHYGMADSSAGYTITLTRSWDVVNDQMATAPAYTLWGNNTTPKYGDLNGASDVNDWFRITTKVGYTIKIALNCTPSTPNPYIDGYLYTNAGALLVSDTSYNITLTYTASYTGDYFFRAYEAAAGYSYGDYSGNSPYYYYIYTTDVDGNDNFADAEWVEPDVTIPSAVSVADLDDYFVFEVPSGYQIHAYGTATNLNTDLYLYDSSQAQVALDDNDPWDITYQHKGLNTELYYARIFNAGGYPVTTYSLTIDLLNIDPDVDGSLVDATTLLITTGENETGTDSLGTTDINDYFSFRTVAGDQILITVTGTDGLVTRLVKDDGTGVEVTLAESVVTSGTATIEFSPNAYYNGEYYYLRVCAPDGTPVGAYNWNVTLIEYDIEDGYWWYANVLEVAPNIIETSSLSPTDTNDWYKLNMPSGCFIDVTVSTTNLADPHMGVNFYGIFSSGIIYDNGSSISFNHTNLFDYSGEVWFQIVNEGYNSGDYTIEVTITFFDNDNNGGMIIADDLPLDANTDGELGYDDINDFYAIEVRSGYNLTIHYNSSHYLGINSGVKLLDADYTLYYYNIGTIGSVTFINKYLSPIVFYLQFYNPCRMFGFNETESVMTYTFNATLINNDPDGDFDRATVLDLKEPAIITDTLFANETKPEYPDINDFFVVEMNKNGNLTLEITISLVSDPWFGFYIYDENQNMVASVTNGTALSLIFIANTTGTYYIRAYNTALKEGAYTMIVTYTPGNSFLNFMTQTWLGLPVWAWFSIGIGGIAIVTVVSIIISRVVKKKKGTATR